MPGKRRKLSGGGNNGFSPFRGKGRGGSRGGNRGGSRGGRGGRGGSRGGANTAQKRKRPDHVNGSPWSKSRSRGDSDDDWQPAHRSQKGRGKPNPMRLLQRNTRSATRERRSRPPITIVISSSSSSSSSPSSEDDDDGDLSSDSASRKVLSPPVKRPSSSSSSLASLSRNSLDRVGVVTYSKPPSRTKFTGAHLHGNQPCVFSGCASEWKASRLWAEPDYFKLNCSGSGLGYDHAVSVMLVPGGEQQGLFSGDALKETKLATTLGDFIDYFKWTCKNGSSTSGNNASASRNGRRKGKQRSGVELRVGSSLKEVADINADVYLAQQPLAALGLEKDLGDLPKCFAKLAKDPGLQTHLWINPRASTSSLHYDSYNGLLVVVRGRKHIRLFAPNELQRPVLSNPVWAEHPNYATPNEPVDEGAECHTVVLKAGDALYIPEGWWHEVSSEPATIAVNFWLSERHSTRARLMQRNPHAQNYYARVLLRDMVDGRLAEMQTEWRAQFAKSVHYSHLTDHLKQLVTSTGGGLDYVAQLLRDNIDNPPRCNVLMQLIPQEHLLRVCEGLAASQTKLWAEFLLCVDCFGAHFLVSQVFDNKNNNSDEKKGSAFERCMIHFEDIEVTQRIRMHLLEQQELMRKRALRYVLQDCLF